MVTADRERTALKLIALSPCIRPGVAVGTAVVIIALLTESSLTAKNNGYSRVYYIVCLNIRATL